MQGYHLSFKDMGKGYENPNLVLHDPDGAQHPDGSHPRGNLPTAPQDGKGTKILLILLINSIQQPRR